ncbi:OB-fold domain-containing protein [Croceicoccus sp. F390]|uniref:OB-fold domain-containing protein n=1 Tax=Croceicoccus esteveae TaxID=3075597 RepID=A0ABU2ZHD7_9SPHN|nr:OB-fold domain-containing protein [Croceicoccus sp. F390]MDT0576005.1 OB-fold domain-containing protein [Croceicoccus sp. F390]
MQPICDTLLTDDDPPRLIGGRDRATGRTVFPCPDDPRFEQVALSRSGTLWSYTVQRFRPKSPPYAGPAAFQPWALGYVELPGETIVEARLAEVAFDAITIGMPMELTMVALDPDATQPVGIPAFRPARTDA